MGKQFGKNPVRTLSLSLIFLCAVSLAGEAPADEYSDMRAAPGPVRRGYLSSAPGYCRVHGANKSIERIESAILENTGGNTMRLTVRVGFTCRSANSCWTDTIEASEYVSAWIDWDGDGRFGKFGDESDAPGRENPLSDDGGDVRDERVMSLLRPVVQHGPDNMLIFTSDFIIPPGTDVTETWMRVALSWQGRIAGPPEEFDPPDEFLNPCNNSWDWGDLKDQPVTISEDSGGDSQVRLTDMYVDDSFDSSIIVNKGRGDFIDIVHILENEGGNPETAALTVSLPLYSDWIFQKAFWRNGNAGATLGETGTADQRNDGSAAHYEVMIPNIGGGTTQAVLRFRIPYGAYKEEVSVSSHLSSDTETVRSASVSVDSQADALIVTNRNKLYETYSGNASELLKKLFSTAEQDRVMRLVIYYADWYDDAYGDVIEYWDNSEDKIYYEANKENEKITLPKNVVATKLDRLIEGWVTRLSPNYLLIVGSDDILPFYRRRYPGDVYPSDVYNAPTYTKKYCFFSDTLYAFENRGDYDMLEYDQGTLNEDTTGVTHWKEVSLSCGRIVGASVADMISLIVRGIRGPGVGGAKNVLMATTSGDTCIDFPEAYRTFDADTFLTGKDGKIMTQTSNWGYEDFIWAANQNPIYIIQGSHGAHIEFYPETGRPCRVSDIEKDVRTLSDDKGYFVGTVSCYGGAIEERTRSHTSSLAYEFIHKGACGYFGSSGYVLVGLNCGEYPYGEGLFNLFIRYLRTSESVGKAYQEACLQYDDLVRNVWTEAIEAKIDKGHEKTVTQFNLFAIPWMRPNLTSSSESKLSGKATVFPESKNGHLTTESVPRRQPAPLLRSSARSGGTFTRTLTFVTTDYEVTKEGDYELVSIPGAESRYAAYAPVLPQFKTSLMLPGDVTVTSLRLTDGTSRSLGKLNIPSYAWIESPSRYTDETHVTGLYPDPNYTYVISTEGDHKKVSIFFAPVQHNVDTKDTTLWTEATVEVEYRVSECVFISGFRADKGTYKTSEEITASVTLENVGDTDLAGLTAVLTLRKGYGGETLSVTEHPVGDVPAGGGTEMGITIGNGQPSGHYSLSLEIRDEDGSPVASAQDGIGVISEQISGFSVPRENWEIGEYIPLPVTCDNFNQYDITADVRVSAENDATYETAEYAYIGVVIPAGESRTYSFGWSTEGYPPGWYTIRPLLLVGDETHTGGYAEVLLTSPDDLNQDLAVDMADFILAMRILVSENIDSAPPGSTDTDGKLGLDDVLRILREIAGDIPVSP